MEERFDCIGLERNDRRKQYARVLVADIDRNHSGERALFLILGRAAVYPQHSRKQLLPAGPQFNTTSRR